MWNNDIYDFLQSQRLLVIASMSWEDIRTTNVFYWISHDYKLYFISSEATKHSQQMLENKQIAFSIAWYNEKNHKDRKAVQWKGVCRVASSEEEIIEWVRLHNLHYPEFAWRIDVDRVKNNEHKTHVWVVEPTYMKFWNDELYWENWTKEFNFSE